MSGHRLEKISEDIKRELSDIMRGLKDPRIPELISIVSVRVSPDYRLAKVYVSCLGERGDIECAVKSLENAAGYVRRELGSRLSLRFTPEVVFIADDSIAHGARISKILTDISKGGGNA